MLAMMLVLLGCSGKDAGAPNITFAIQPSTVEFCLAHAVAKVTWNVKPAGIHSIKIFAQATGGVETLFVEGAAEGSADTGPWVEPGLVLRLRDGDSGKEIADLTVKGKKC